MTKDRRLGRGLAALLGTPIEEDQIVDGVASSHSTQPPSNPSNRMSASSPTRGSMSPQVNSSMSANGSSPKKREGVTGAVALKPSQPAEQMATSGSLELNVDMIDNNPFQPRRKFNEEEIASLAESIREHQQLQPVLVRKVGDRYQLISGERRLRATIHAGFKTIRAEVREADDRLVAELAIVENLQRKDLDAIEKALSFRRYLDEHRCKQDDLAKRLKIDRSTIANLMRLLELPQTLQEDIQSEKLTAGHARALLPLGNEKHQLHYAKCIQEEGWSVRETERRVAELITAEDNPVAGRIAPAAPNRKRSTPQIAALEQQLRLSLGTKTEIRQTTSGRGKITISFANSEEFERICALICPQADQRTA